MHLKDIRFIFFLTLLFLTPLESSLKDGHRFAIAPEVYWVKRERDKGSHQTGWLGGVRVEYDRIFPCALYWGGYLDWARGPLSGKNGRGDRIKSTLTDYEIEGRVGFTFHEHWIGCFTLTPFAGWGYYRAKSDFKHPTPILVTIKDTYEYAAGGVLFRSYLTNLWMWGIDFIAKYMMDGKSRLEDREERTSETMSVAEEWQYEVNLPILYRQCCKQREVQWGIVPFWRLKQFGGRENYPHDFFKTTYLNWGLRLEGAFVF
jgi:hypothetical protein